jgi:TfoX/Sxy family transcriptional regulator of competence genes
MATQQSTIDFLLDQISSIPTIRARKMFGEYALYADEKVVALVCDDNLFIKPTTASQPFMEFCELAPPYPGSKDYLKVSGEKWDDGEWLTDFITQTVAALPTKKK